MSESLSVFALGSTGLVGGHFLNLALKASNVANVLTVTRRLPKPTSDKLIPVVGADTEEWPELIKKNAVKLPDHSTVFSAFGTTRAAAGSAEKFIKIDHGVNVDAFKAAKETGKFDTAVLVSSLGANAKSSFLYMSTKGKIEEDLKDLKFKRTVILRPGVLLGEREKSKGLTTSVSMFIGKFLRNTIPLGSPVYAEEVAKAALYLSQQPIEKDGEVIVYDSSEIVKLVKEKKL